VRPVRLEIEGFTSFREKQTIDFSDLDLFAITGPTGAGKSSVIDALVFALYGQVPRVGDDYKQLISHGAERLNVLLEFDAGKERYRIARTARPAGASKQRLERIEDGEAQPLADRAKDIRARIETLLGLDYDGFTRAVVLPQGQFDEFLKGEPKERRKILVSLLNLGIYDAIQKLANQKRSDARKESGFIAEQLERDFADATEATLASRRRELTDAEGEAERLAESLAALGAGLTLAQTLRAARREIAALERDAAAEEAKRADAEAKLARGDETRRALDDEVKALDERIETLGVDPERRTVLVDARPRAEQLAERRDQVAKIDRARSDGEASLQTLRDRHGEAETAVPKAEESRRDAEAAVKAARGELERTHRAHAAVALRRDLEVGEPCPVCEQAVPKIPKGRAPAIAAAEKVLVSAERAEARAAAELEKARLALQRAEAAAAALEGDLARLGGQREELVASAGVLERALKDAGFEDRDLADVDRLIEDLAVELKALDAARAKKAELEGQRRVVDQKRAALRADLAGAAARRDEATSRLAGFVTRRGEASRVVDTTVPSLSDLASKEGWTGLGDDPARDEVDTLENRRTAAQRASQDVAGRVGALRGEVERTGKKIARATELREKKQALDADAALLKTLSDHLRANELVAWIQEEALRRLAQDGSDHLARLSQGRYGLRLGSGEGAVAGARAEQDFFVIDHWNAEGVRSVKTLSGGETFLASLALALALAESLARLSAGGRAVQALESLFLDEGFGSLDGETLDTVVAALDALHGGQRLVGVVTHVRDLAERMPARLEVRRQGSTATATVV
jgi:exonuclease SbcC